MVTVDLAVKVVGGIGSVALSGPAKLIALCVTAPGVTFDYNILDDKSYGIGGQSGNSGTTTFSNLAGIPTLARGGTLQLANVSKDATYNVRVYSELSPTTPVQR